MINHSDRDNQPSSVFDLKGESRGKKLAKYSDLRQCVTECTVEDWCREDVRNVGFVGYGRATDVTFQTLKGRLPDGQEDRRTVDFRSSLTVLRR